VAGPQGAYTRDSCTGTRTGSPIELAVAQSAKQPSLEAYPVSRRVADRKRDDYFLLEPAALEPGDATADE